MVYLMGRDAKLSSPFFKNLLCSLVSGERKLEVSVDKRKFFTILITLFLFKWRFIFFVVFIYHVLSKFVYILNLFAWKKDLVWVIMGTPICFVYKCVEKTDIYVALMLRLLR